MTPQQRDLLKIKLLDRLEESQSWRFKCLRLLIEQQTESEQASGVTIERNGRGLSAFDAPMLSGFNDFLQKRGFLSAKQDAILLRRLIKYSGQLIEILEDREPETLDTL